MKNDYRELIEYYSSWASLAFIHGHYDAASTNTINCIRVMMVQIREKHCLHGTRS